MENGNVDGDKGTAGKNLRAAKRKCATEMWKSKAQWDVKWK